MAGQGFLAWILSALALHDTGNQMVNNTKMDTVSNTTMDNKGFMQDQDNNNVRKPFTILVEGNVGSGTPVCVVIIPVKGDM